MDNTFSSDHILNSYQYLNSINWRKGMDEEDDFSELDEEFEPSYRSEPKNYGVVNDFRAITDTFTEQTRDSAQIEKTEPKTP